MMVALALFAYAAFLPLVVAPVMFRFRVFDRAPNLGILAWQVLVASTLSSVVLGGMSLLVPSAPVSSGIADFLEACSMLIRQRYATPAGALLGGTGLALATVVTMRTGYHLAKVSWEARRQRRAHQHTLALVGRDGPDDTTLLEHTSAAAYCLPGGQDRVVLTTGALQALSADQLRAVLAHERAHLRHRHHLILLLAGAIANAFPHSRTFRTAHSEIARLVELAADDAAVRNTDRFTLAEALLTLNSGRSPAATLAARGSTAAARVRRLIDAHSPLRLAPSVTGAALALLVLVLPLTVATGPALTAIGADHCSIDPATWKPQITALFTGFQGHC
ncbi:Zn-dependent protease with chaperone function [Saccharopolyspora lacisalsi]|uniref:Zn-dependent protease with chaperone function n=1 Tax=Halosaccharopolyspora lacisalsi TaxID=1000566 RepID=A0A839DV31_9PSEU|nr:M56 family metallopeptidase [Halosaccharopolyspora lacisalsi]MBA8824116.1 Zn-dependent protease with chaperone function [Halosaccharopolyspora lacisalsi]